MALYNLAQHIAGMLQSLKIKQASTNAARQVYAT